MPLRKNLYVLLLSLPLLALTGCDKPLPTQQSQTVPIDDNSLSLAISDALQQEELYQRSHITVTSLKGQVKLTGTVSSMLDKNRASDIAKKVDGVRDVNNSLEVIVPANPY